MAVTYYDIGDIVRINGVFRDVSSNLQDPTTLAIRISVPPTPTTTTYTYGTDTALEKDGTGLYHIDFTIAVAGTHGWSWVASGTGQASEYGEFYVRKSITTGAGERLIESARTELDDEESPYRYSNKVILNALKKAVKRLNWGFTISSSGATTDAIFISLSPASTEEDELWIAELASIYARKAKGGTGKWRDGDISWDGTGLQKELDDFFSRAAWHQPSTNSDTYFMSTTDMQNRDKISYGVEREIGEYYDANTGATVVETYDVSG